MGFKRLLKNFLPSLLADERGQSTTEYILILAIVVMVAMQVKKTLPNSILKVLGKVTNEIDTAADSNSP